MYDINESVRCNTQKVAIENELKNLKRNFNISCYMLKDLCFESMLLRTNILNKVYSKDISCVCFCFDYLFNDKPLNCDLYLLLKNIKNTSGLSANTCEQIVSKILSELTMNINGFLVKKNRLGLCWYCSCGVVRNNINNNTSHCYYKNGLHDCYYFTNNNCFNLCSRYVNSTSNNGVFSQTCSDTKSDIVLLSLGVADWKSLFTSI